MLKKKFKLNSKENIDKNPLLLIIIYTYFYITIFIFYFKYYYSKMHFFTSQSFIHSHQISSPSIPPFNCCLNNQILKFPWYTRAHTRHLMHTWTRCTMLPYWWTLIIRNYALRIRAICIPRAEVVGRLTNARSALLEMYR